MLPPGFVIRGPALQLFDADGVEYDIDPLGLGEWATPDDLPTGTYTIEGQLGDRLTIEVTDVEPLQDVALPLVTDTAVTRERGRRIYCPEEPERLYTVWYEMAPVAQSGWAIGLVDEEAGLASWGPAAGDSAAALGAGTGEAICPTLVVSDPQGVWVHTEALPCAGCGGCATNGPPGGWLGLLALGLLRRRRP
ncbi:MAG: hypothetical protein H6739_21650 [Alphaproteobacteria bacterium]|nr:hypothetical protein [Alphaproteobacteria bacterium]